MAFAILLAVLVFRLPLDRWVRALAGTIAIGTAMAATVAAGASSGIADEVERPQPVVAWETQGGRTEALLLGTTSDGACVLLRSGSANAVTVEPRFPFEIVGRMPISDALAGSNYVAPDAVTDAAVPTTVAIDRPGDLGVDPERIRDRFPECVERARPGSRERDGSQSERSLSHQLQHVGLLDAIESRLEHVHLQDAPATHHATVGEHVETIGPVEELPEQSKRERDQPEAERLRLAPRRPAEVGGPGEGEGHARDDPERLERPERHHQNARSHHEQDRLAVGKQLRDESRDRGLRLQHGARVGGEVRARAIRRHLIASGRSTPMHGRLRYRPS